MQPLDEIKANIKPVSKQGQKLSNRMKKAVKKREM
jgi:hypothetical protein